MTAQGKALLAIWSDIAAAAETDYQHWLTREHVLERVGVDGFLAGRVFRSLNPAQRRYFINYQLQEHAVLAGPSYMARLNAPTPWSQRIMPQLQNFKRGGGDIIARAGLGQGGIVSPLRFDISHTTLSSANACQALVDQLASLDGISTVWLLQVNQDATNVQTKEKQMRSSQEGAFGALLCIEGLTAPAVLAAAEQGKTALGGNWENEAPELYSQCYSLDKRIAGLE